MATLLYYTGFGLGIILLIVLVLLWVFLEIRSAARFLMAHQRHVPKLLQNANNPISIFDKKKKRKVVANELTQEDERTVLLEDTQLIDEDEITVLIDTFDIKKDGR
ncbi:MAG: hypothetical protein RSA63_06505 [Eubacterium sp.]